MMQPKGSAELDTSQSVIVMATCRVHKETLGWIFCKLRCLDLNAGYFVGFECLGTID